MLLMDLIMCCCFVLDLDLLVFDVRSGMVGDTGTDIIVSKLVKRLAQQCTFIKFPINSWSTINVHQGLCKCDFVPISIQASLLM